MSSRDQTVRLRLLRWGVHAATACALLLAGLAYYALAVCPLATHRKQQLADTKRLEKMQAAAANARRTLVELRTDLANEKRREAELLARIPQRADEHEFLQAITLAANEAGLHVVDYRRESATDEPTHSALRISLKCRGSFAAICQVLDRLQRIDRLIIIEHLHVASDMASDDQTLGMTIVLFYGLKSPALPEEPNDV